MSKIYIKTASGHNGDYPFHEQMQWASTSITRAAKQWAHELNHRLLTERYGDDWDRENVEDHIAAQADADHAIREVHYNCDDDMCFAAPDFVWVVGEHKTLRPQIKESAVLRELKKGYNLFWYALDRDMEHDGCDWEYHLEAHDSI